jgi:DNA (cytosine-5)-methyltransferase 1
MASGRDLTSSGSGRAGFAADSGPAGSGPPVPDGAAAGGPFPFLEFFAGSGLVSLAMGAFFQAVWANDVCPRKAAVFAANHRGIPFELGSVADVRGGNLPGAALSWASFPCQDLSLAGKGAGLGASRSGLVWQWLRVMDEMPRRPPILAMENVSGLVSARGGQAYRSLHGALADRGYRAGAMLLDAVRWLPHSRPRVFVVAVDGALEVPGRLLAGGPTWAHPPAVRRAAEGLGAWLWWSLPAPVARPAKFSEIVDYSLPCHDEAASLRNLSMVPEAHLARLSACGLKAVPGYKRSRGGRQVLELRFDETSGCLRTPSGGSSRQYLVIKRGGAWRTRILSPREAARLMGAPDGFRLPGSFNDGYKAMGDAVAVPVAEHLARHLLAPLAGAHGGWAPNRPLD